MQEKVVEYLKKTKEIELVMRGLFDREYFDNDFNASIKQLNEQQRITKYPGLMYDDLKNEYFLPIPWDVTEEEYELITKATFNAEKANERTFLIRLFNWLGVIMLSMTIIAGVIAGSEFSTDTYAMDRPFDWALAFTIWVSGSITSFFILAFAKIIELLQEISNKQKL